MLATGDAATSLGELLSWSHRQLSAPAAAMFALLGVHCGPDATIPAAASLAGVPAAEAGRVLAELADASLVAEHRPGRYVMHDLVRGYAAGLASQALGVAGVRAAIARCLDHYLHTMVISYDFPRSFTPAPPAPGVVPERIAGRQRADWARAEHQVLVRAVAQAAAAGLLTHAWQIYNCLTWLLADQGYWADCQAAGQAVLAAAESAGDHAALGWTHTIIMVYCSFIGAYHDGRAHHVQARGHFRRAGDLAGQAWADLSAGMACSWARNWVNGAALAEQALALFRQAGIHAGEGWALYVLGEYHAQLGNNELARGYARRALAAGPRTGDPTGAAYAWKALGLVHSRLGEQQQAISCYQQALALARKWRTPLARRWLAGLLVDFGDACRAAGDLSAAAGAWQQAQQILDDLHLPDELGVHAALAAAGGLAILLPGPAWAASGPQPASGTFRETSVRVDSETAADGNTILVVTVNGITTGTFDGPFIETDTVVIHPDGSVTLAGMGTQSGTLGTCGTGSAPYVTEAQGTLSARTGRLQTIDQAASTSTALMAHTVDSFTVNAVTGEGTYAGTYHCT